MYLYQSTPVPTEILDKHLPYLNLAQCKVLLVVVRQTLGWIDPKTKKPKVKDWISIPFFQRKTGIRSRKAISSALTELIRMNLILAFDRYDNTLKTPQDRRGKKRIYYAYAPYYRLRKNKTCGDRLKNMWRYVPNTIPTHTIKDRGEVDERFAKGNRLTDIERYRQILNEQKKNR